MALPGQISAINAGVTSFKELEIDSQITTINVHSNAIESFHGLEFAPRLAELNVSSNEITSLSGLSGFTHLVVLNLASNKIANLHGLGSLVNLVYFNVSYNSISNLEGFREVNGPSYKLEAVELHGNRINDLQDIFAHMTGILTLSYVVFSQDRQHENPVCKLPNYRSRVFQHIPQLISLDNRDRSNQIAVYNHPNVLEGISLDLTDIDQISTDPTSSSQHSSEPNRNIMSTPRIDAVLSSTSVSAKNPTQTGVETIESFVESFISSMEEKECIDKSEKYRASEKDQEERLKYLETQLANLVAARQETGKNDNTPTEKQKKDRNVNLSSGSSVVRPRVSFKKAGHKTKTKAAGSVVPKQEQGKGIAEKETYLNLVKELETERERRWKSEEATRKLAELVRKLSHEKSEGRSLQDMAAETAEKLKQSIIREKEKSEKVKLELLECKEKLAEVSDELVACMKLVEEQKQMAEKSESKVAEALVNNSKVVSEQAKRLHESEMRASSALREVEAQKAKNLCFEKHASELQDALCAAKRHHEKDLENLFSIDSIGFKRALSKEVNKQEKCHREEIKTLQETICQLKQQYLDLEDEFRQALLIEANRFSKVQDENSSCVTELRKLRGLYQKSKDKEQKCQSIISELTSVAKEQKLKIMELVNGKKESSLQYEDRISKLEVIAENGRKNGVQLELVKQEKSRLISQLAALQTVVDGLRDERKLWGHELAQQGASLAQDRGRLESKIESLQQEVITLKKENERDLDTLRIKSKIVEDQTESIHKMKQGLVEKDQEIIKIQDESLDRHRKLEQEIEDLNQDNSALNEQITALLERKKELKDHLADSERELDELKAVHSRLVKKWSEKGQILTQLEKQVKNMKDSYDKKVQNAVKERDDALESKHLLTERLAKADAAFREQLEAANAAHQNQLDMMAKNCTNEVDMMKRKVCSVEEEMREVLRDAERQKKSMEARFNKVTSVFQELQDGFKM